MLREFWKKPANRSAFSDRRVGWLSATQPAVNTPAEHDLALIEAAICLHDRALSDGEPSPQHPSVGSPVGAPILIVLSGKPEDRARAQPASVDLVLRPEVSTGWRSESVARMENGGKVRVELVTAQTAPVPQKVARLSTPFRHAGRPAGTGMGSGAGLGIGGRHAARTSALHRLGQVDRDHSDRHPFEPDQITALGASALQAGAAPSALAALWTTITAIEATVPLHPRFPPAPCLRRLHVFAEIEMGMACAVSTALFRGAQQAPASHSLRSSIRRLDDGATLAVCETVLR